MRMDQGYLDMMRCPSRGCGSTLRLFPLWLKWIMMRGVLNCAVCSIIYPIRNGIPRFLDEDQAGAVTRTTAGFDYEWQQA